MLGGLRVLVIYSKENAGFCPSILNPKPPTTLKTLTSASTIADTITMTHNSLRELP